MGRSKYNVIWRCLEERARGLLDSLAQILKRRWVRLAGLSQYDEPLHLSMRIQRRKDRYASLSDAGKIADNLLELVRIDVPAGANDDVLGAARDIDISVRDVRQVTRLEP
jgi:hypothetical protein